MGLYGLLITSTGWTFEQADHACMSRVLELIDYLRRGRQPGSQPSEPPSHRSEMTDADFSRDALELQSFLGGASPLPAHLREAILWAEEQKTKMN